MHASFFWRTTLLTADMKGLRKVFNAIWIENIYTLQSHFCDYRKYLESVVFAEEQILQKIQKDLFVNFTIIINIHLTLFQLSGIYHLTSLPPTLPLPPLWHTLQIMASSTYKWCHIIYFDACYRAPINPSSNKVSNIQRGDIETFSYLEHIFACVYWNDLGWKNEARKIVTI